MQKKPFPHNNSILNLFNGHTIGTHNINTNDVIIIHKHVVENVGVHHLKVYKSNLA